ncbi:hypothetical protein SKAU_G00023310 [Synaphobranchus kaupii]|uniref:Rab-GAP TBC domain-containing protein n=1 Tax=Synaphobranchus kaupii TaxID=118154 RepID=A0A9Q1JDC1_SYNKA|nr:hypothetical protein SKAU_G00023310 [Synaphobranchus kaupii]
MPCTVSLFLVSPKLMRFQDHHDRILKKTMPKLKQHLDNQEVFTNLYTMKWFFQCFLDRTPFTLTLRIWDIYILEGERVLTAMSYTVLKLHKKHLMKLSMEELVEFLQVTLSKDFFFEDDFVIDQLQNSMSELRRSKLELPAPGREDEFPKKPLGSTPARASSHHQPHGEWPEPQCQAGWRFRKRPVPARSILRRAGPAATPGGTRRRSWCGSTKRKREWPIHGGLGRWSLGSRHLRRPLPWGPRCQTPLFRMRPRRPTTRRPTTTPTQSPAPARRSRPAG